MPFLQRHTHTHTYRRSWVGGSALGWSVKRLQGWPNGSTDWQAKSACDCGRGSCVRACVRACVWGGLKVGCLVIHVFSHSDCWITKSKPVEKGREAAAFTVSSSWFYKRLSAAVGGKTLSWEKTDWGWAREGQQDRASTWAYTDTGVCTLCTHKYLTGIHYLTP